MSRRPANPVYLGRALALMLALALCGCASRGGTGEAVALASPPTGEAALRDYAAVWSRRHDADPADATASINYAGALRGLTQYAQAAAVLESAAAKSPYDKAVLAAYGKALADAGRLREAVEVLGRAHSPDRPDWSVLSAQGSVADQMGDHAAALNYYGAALKIRPGEPSVLSNLGLSYALVHELQPADEALRAAVANPRADMRVRQNYALVLTLEGRFNEAEQVARQDLGPADAAASVASIRRMIVGGEPWRALGKTKPARRPGQAAAPATAG